MDGHPLSESSLRLFQELLAAVQLQAAHPDFEKKARAVIDAKRELAEALAADRPPD